MRKLFARLFAVGMVTAFAGSAATLQFYTYFGPEASGATGTGRAFVTYDSTAQTLAFDVLWQGLSANTTVAHIHCCVLPPGTVGVAVSPPTLPGFPVGVKGGSYVNIIDLSLNSSFGNAFRNANGGTAAGATAALIAGLTNGTAYFNIHSTRFPSGEIRGFFAPVPEPSTFVVGGLALAALAFLRRR